MYQNQFQQSGSYAANQAASSTAQSQSYWALDQASAEQAGENSYISEAGLYTCTIERAEYIRAKTGSHGLLVRFFSGDKKGSFIINYAKANNEKIFGADFINAMIFLADLRGFSWAPATNEKGQPIQVAAELAGKTMGFYLGAEQDAQGRTNLSLLRVYHSRSLHTVSEILAGRQPEAIPKIQQQLAQRQ